MKKTIALVLAILMVATMSMTAFAGTMSDVGSDSADVKGTYEEGSSGGTIYSIDITWGAMEFTFTDVSEGTWDPSTHEYVDTADASWSASGNTVKVTNHSNTGVDVTFAYSKATGFESVTGTLDVTSQSLATAVGTAVSAAPSVTSTLTLSGTLASTTAAKTKVGSVVVTIE